MVVASICPAVPALEAGMGRGRGALAWSEETETIETLPLQVEGENQLQKVSLPTSRNMLWDV